MIACFKDYAPVVDTLLNFHKKNNNNENNENNDNNEKKKMTTKKLLNVIFTKSINVNATH